MFALILLAQEAAAVAPPHGPSIVSYPSAYFKDQLPANALEMVQRLPGFTLDVGFAARGLDQGGGNVLLNGARPTSKSEKLEDILKGVSFSQIERIDVIRGSAPGVDMQGKSVVANVIVKPSRSLRGQLSLGYFQYWRTPSAPSMRLEFSGPLAKANWSVNLLHVPTTDDAQGDGFGRRLGSAGELLRASDIEADGRAVEDAVGGALQTPFMGGQLQLNGRLFWRKYKFEEDNVGFAPTPDLQTSDDRDQYHDTELGLHLRRPAGASTLEVFGLHQTRDQNKSQVFANPATQKLFDQHRRTSEDVLRAVARRPVGPRLNLEVGAEGAQNVLRGDSRLVLNGAEQRLPAAHLRVSELRGQAWVNAFWRPAPNLSLDGGVRFETSSVESRGDVALEKQLSFIKPRATLTWSAGPRTQVRLRLERYVGQLNFDDLVATTSFSTGSALTAGNPGLEPERMWVYEVGVDRQLWPGAQAVISLRRRNIDNVLDRRPVFGGGQVADRRDNIGKGVKEELIASLTTRLDAIGLKRSQLKVEGHRRRSSVIDPVSGQRRPISTFRPAEWTANFQQEAPAWRASWGIDVTGGWRETVYTFQEETLKTRTMVKTYFDWKADDATTVHLEFYNLLGRGVRRVTTSYAGARGLGEPTVQDLRHLEIGHGAFIRIRRKFGD